MCFVRRGRGPLALQYQWRQHMTRPGALALEVIPVLGMTGEGRLLTGPCPLWALRYSHTGTQMKFGSTAGPDFGLLLGFMDCAVSMSRNTDGFYKWNHNELQISLQTSTRGLRYIQRERERSQKALCLCLVVFPALENYVMIITYASSWGTVWRVLKTFLLGITKKVLILIKAHLVDQLLLVLCPFSCHSSTPCSFLIQGICQMTRLGDLLQLPLVNMSGDLPQDPA